MILKKKSLQRLDASADARGGEQVAVTGVARR
jgi:hypothetical protein